MTLSEKQIKDLFDNASATDVEKSICAQVSGLTLAVVRQAMSAAEPYKWLFNTAHSDIKPYLVYKTKDGSKEAVDIENGFILKYDGFEVNCTLKAIFDECMDDLKFTVSKALFN